MILNAQIEDQIYSLNVPDPLLSEAADFFAQMDQDMAKGIQLGRYWVATPNREQCCQYVANRLLTALENENHKLGRLMAAYLLDRLPPLDRVEIDTSGEADQTLFHYQTDASAQPSATAMEQAASQISQVFKAGKQWKFSVFDPNSGSWSDSPAFANETEAESARQQALQQRAGSLSLG